MKKSYFFLVSIVVTNFTSVNAQIPIASTSFEEPTAIGGNYTDPNTAAHSLVNNGGPIVNYTSIGGEMGFNASFVPYDTPSTGLSDGDAVGVTTDVSEVTTYTQGGKGYTMSDTDGSMILTFDAVDFTGYQSPSVKIDYFLSVTGWEYSTGANNSGNDVLRIYVKDLTNATETDIFFNTQDINNLGIEGAWQNGLATGFPDEVTLQLVIEFRSNASTEELFLDKVEFEAGAALGVTDNKIEKFNIFPNPSNTGSINITTVSNSPKHVQVFDMLGKKVIDQKIDTKLNISSLRSGIYVVKVTENNFSTTKRLVVK